MKAGRPWTWRLSSRRPGPSRSEVLGSLALFAALGAIGWVCAVLSGRPL